MGLGLGMMEGYSVERMRSRIGFLIVLAVIGLPLACRVWAIAPLYASAEMRVQVERAVRAITEREGWILSDIEVRRVEAGSMVIAHRAHIRGPDPVSCFIVDLPVSSLRPCAE